MRLFQRLGVARFAVLLGSWLALGTGSSAQAEEAAKVAAPAVVSKEAELTARAIKVPAGYRVTAVASEPNVANPVAFCFDGAGRIFVAETFRVHRGVEDNRNHMDWLDDDLAARTVADRRAYTVRRMGENIGQYTEFSDRVRMLEDRDGDGRYETASIFSDGYHDVEEGVAAGVLWVDDRLLLTCIPSLWELRDADGDGVAEHKRALQTGYGVRFAFFGHDLHGLCRGPDGKVYFSVGDRGLNVETPEGPVENVESGAVLRCLVDGSELELVATGLRNPQELAFNEFGDLFTVDNNSDSGDRARLVHVVEGMDAGWRMAYQYLPDRGPFNREKVWHPQNDEQPASIVPPLANFSDGPSGLVYNPGTGMAAEQEGVFFLCDFRGSPAASYIRQFWVKPKGATYELDRESLFAENILATDCDFGPDGAFYICDWIEGWGDYGKGRIHRVDSDDPRVVAEREESAAKLRAIPVMNREELLAALAHPHMGVRLAAQRRLVANEGDAADALVELAENVGANKLARIHAIWALGELGEADGSLWQPLAALRSADADAEIRAQTARTLGRAARAAEPVRNEVGAALVPLLAEESTRVRSMAAISIGKIGYQPALAALLQLVRENDDADPALRHAAVMGLAGTQSDEGLSAAAAGGTTSERLAILLALGRHDSPLVATFLTDDDQGIVLDAARIIWDRRLTECYDELAAVLEDCQSENEPLVRRALAASVAVRTPEALRAMIEFALRADAPQAMRDHAWELAKTWAAPAGRDPVLGQWRPLEARPAADLTAALAAALPAISRAAAKDATGLVVAAECGVSDAFEPLLAVAEDESQPESLRARAIAALGAADAAAAEQIVESGLKSKHAGVRIAVRDLLVQRFPERAVACLREAIDGSSPGEQQAALAALAALEATEARELIAAWFDRVEDGSCPPHLVLDAIEAAGRCGDETLSKRIDERAVRIAKENASAQYADCLVGGNATRGKRVFEEHTALSCRRCHSVSPGEVLVGPNLASIGLERKREELLESIVHPNAKIVEGFKTTVLQLDTGEVVSGILRREDDEKAVLVDAEGKEFAVDVAAIEDRLEGKSAMPEKLADLATRFELRDLVEYLSTLRVPVSDGAESGN
jgi:quinoprotein glucose dehydrogenase